MNRLTLTDLEDRNLILYKHIAGSKLYGLDTKESDLDIHGVFIAPKEMILGLSENYQDIIQDEKNDTVFHELKKFIDLLCKSNPTMLEMLYVPNDKIIGNVHKSIKEIIKNRDLFLTKQTFEPFCGYAQTQIKKARHLGKLISIDKIERKNAIDFCYTFNEQGSIKISTWLEKNGLKQEFCGVCKIPNMHDTYGIYYDFKKHLLNLTDFEKENILYKKFIDFSYKNFINKKSDLTKDNIIEFIKSLQDVKYYGIFSNIEKSNQVSLSSILKYEQPICYLTFNEQGYSKHCIDYKNYCEWVEKRNPVRYAANLVNNYDVKNMSHVFRLLEMGIEIARGDGFNVVRTHDNKFLRDIKSGKFEYEYLIELAEQKKCEMENLIKKCTLPEKINRDTVNDLLVSIRLDQIKNQ